MTEAISGDFDYAAYHIKEECECIDNHHDDDCINCEFSYASTLSTAKLHIPDEDAFKYFFDVSQTLDSLCNDSLDTQSTFVTSDESIKRMTHLLYPTPKEMQSLTAVYLDAPVFSLLSHPTVKYASQIYSTIRIDSLNIDTVSCDRLISEAKDHLQRILQASFDISTPLQNYTTHELHFETLRCPMEATIVEPLVYCQGAYYQQVLSLSAESIPTDSDCISKMSRDSQAYIDSHLTAQFTHESSRTLQCTFNALI